MGRKTLAERFWPKVAVGRMDECWLWKGSKQGMGRNAYGVMKINGKYQGAHRIAYQLNVGAIPDGFVVMHMCDVPQCVNPAHLRVGTYKDNSEDMMQKGRGYLGYGEAHMNAKLTTSQIKEIRHLAENGTNHRAIGKLFGVSNVTIYKIVSGQTWSHVK